MDSWKMAAELDVVGWDSYPYWHHATSDVPDAQQAVAHGSDSVMYFQWRKSRGNFEQFHGAVVDHCGHEHTLVFRDVADTGKALQDLRPVLGAHTDAQVAIYWDWDNFWAAELACAPVQGGQQERQTAIDHYRAFWNLGIPVDMVGPHSSLDGYTLLIAPMLYVTTTEAAERFRRFVVSVH